MKNFGFVLLLLSGLVLLSRKVLATHCIGGEITYEAVGPTIFKATYKGYYDVSAAMTQDPITFQLRSPGCNPGFTFAATSQSQYYQYINGSGSNNCPGNPPNFVLVREYTATFSLSLSHFSCPEWYLSVQECQVYAGANFQNNPNSCLYVEATLTPMAVIFAKSSPKFLPAASLLFNLNAPATFSNLATQTDIQPDSVVYLLKPALNDHNTPLNYAPGFTFSHPLPTSSGVVLHPNTGLMTFTPNVYHTGSANVNRYTVVVEATGYRNVNGVVRKVGASQRRLPIFIRNNSANANPEIINVTANGQPVQPNGIVLLQAGSPLSFQFATSDANQGDIISIVMPDPLSPLFPWNANFTSTGGKRPSGTISFTAPHGLSDKIYYFPITVMDNSCPVRTVITQTFGVKILANPTGISNAFSAGVGFSAYPNPFTTEISFWLKETGQSQRIQIYNLLGQQVDVITIGKRATAEGRIYWPNAPKMPAGAYVARLIADGKTLQVLKFTKQQ